MIYFGVDPGMSGAICAVDQVGAIIDTIRLKETRHDVGAWLRDQAQDALILDKPIAGLIEQVHSMPKQGVSSTFKFGRSYGECIGMLTAFLIPFEFITPAKWQGLMSCRSKGDKNVTKRRAQQLYPSTKIIHATADAILLARLCWLQNHERISL